jgi:hypothetical protein
MGFVRARLTGHRPADEVSLASWRTGLAMGGLVLLMGGGGERTFLGGLVGGKHWFRRGLALVG